MTNQTLRQIVVSGIRPTGFIHLGNYFGAIKNYVQLQHTHNCFFFIADIHSLTTHPDTQQLAHHTKRVVAEYLACGLDPNKCAIYAQSSLPETAELYLYLSMLAYKGELEKTASFKEKIKIHHQNINAGLLTYPVLMAADILIHQAQYVPVGKDQEQHLEMTRNFANRFNHRYGQLFPEPVAFNFGEDLIKIPSLDGMGKMSKSENENATIYLSDDDDTIRKKMMKAKTDGGPTEPNSVKPTEIANLFYLLKIIAPQDVHDDFNHQYNTCTIKYGVFKKELAERVVAFVNPIRTRTEYYLNNDHDIKNALQQGQAKAQQSARQTLNNMKQLMHLNYTFLY